MSENTKAYKFETLQQHAGQIADPTTGSRAVPIYQTTSYVFDSTQDGEDQFALRKPGYIYSRLANPTQEVFENVLPHWKAVRQPWLQPAVRRPSRCPY